MKVSTDICTLDEYLKFWYLKPKNKLLLEYTVHDLLANFQHIQSLIFVQPKVVGKKTIKTKYLLCSLSTHPCDLLLNYLLQVEFAELTTVQKRIYHCFFGGFNKTDNYLPYQPWISLEAFFLAFPFVDTRAIKEAPVTTRLSHYPDRGELLFKEFAYYDNKTNFYMKEKFINFSLFRNWNKETFKVLDTLGFIDGEDSYVKNVLVSDRKRLYLQVKNKVDHMGLYALTKVYMPDKKKKV